MKQIKLTQNKIALVDDIDFEKINQYSWHIRKGKKPYARTTIWNKTKKKPQLFYMHRIILELTDPKIHVDHIDGNGLNNQRANLRIATSLENNRNVFKQPNKTSQFKGVSYCNSRKKFKASISLNNKETFLGRFEKEIDAAYAYNEAAIKYFGKFARLNKI